MIKYAKSALLVLLVAASFVQTGLLWYSSPSYEESRQNYYLKPPPIGSEKFQKEKAYELAAPQEFILHQKGEHRKVLPKGDRQKYESLLEKLDRAETESAELIDPSPSLWKEMIEKRTGLELRFNHDFPPGTVQTLFNTQLPELESVSRIWIFEEDQSKELFAWFISDREQEVMQTTIKVQSFDDWIRTMGNETGGPLEPVFSDGGSEWDKENQGIPCPFYLPENRPAMNRYTFRLKGPIKPEHMKQILFRDPDLARQSLVLDNTYIYTDGRSNLQHNTRTGNMVYNDPATNTNRKSTLTEDLNAINQFMNRHSGWTGNYLLDTVELDKNSGLPDYIFRLFVDHSPVYWSDKDSSNPGTIRLSTTGKGITAYERSLRYLSTDPKQNIDELPNQEELLDALQEKGIDLLDIRWIHPGYQAVSKSDRVQLIPCWVIVLNDDERKMIPTAEAGGETDGLE
ncbi:YycH family regulatory protein [Paludifilum halophilum]|uniref:Regulatory protein YycH domain-containing protein n=1 Tax=Paludifilum halophilum TaxID=1642702 RepID=A0A235B6M3_9BACL|nr:two-component system activity regulator YycH [Paludifilum halophilum]OYD07948.1 hypothetical protein CHM34_07440 [Paludifilum halophilum]